MLSSKVNRSVNKELVFNKELVKVLIYLFICSLGWMLPAPAPITPVGMKVIFIFVATIIAWTATTHVWPSFFSCILFPATGVVTMKQFIAMGWGGDIFYFVVFSFILSKFLEEVGVSQYISARLMGLEFIKGHPWRLITMLLFVAFLICGFVNTFIGIFLTWEIVYAITRTVNLKPHDKFPTLMVFGVAMQGALGLGIMPWRGNAIINLGAYSNVIGEAPNMLNYIAFSLPVGLLSIGAYVLLCRFVFKLDVTPLKEISDEMFNPDDLELTAGKKIALSALGVFIFLLLMPNFLKAGPIAEFFANMGVVGVMIFIFGILSLVRINGKNLLNFGQIAAKAVPWNMIVMIVVILALGGIIMNPATGIKDFIQESLAPVFVGMSSFTFVIAVSAITVLLTNFMINIVVVAMLLPVIIGIAPTVGINPEQISYLVMLLSVTAILTPAASAATSVLFPNADWIRTSDIYKYGSITVLTISIIAIAVNFVVAAFIY